MDPSLAATKANLINLKKSLDMAKIGYDLLDKKRNVLIKELTPLLEVAKTIRSKIEKTFKKAYSALKIANVTLGMCDFIADGAFLEDGINITYKSVMGVVIPKITLVPTSNKIHYRNLNTNSQLDIAFMSFNEAKQVIIILAEVENSTYFLAKEIKKTKVRANALKNVVIPNIEKNIKFISDSIEEKEREEFGRLKIIKKTKI